MTLMSNPDPNPMPVDVRPMGPSMRYDTWPEPWLDVPNRNCMFPIEDCMNVYKHSPHPVNTTVRCTRHYCIVVENSVTNSTRSENQMTVCQLMHRIVLWLRHIGQPRVLIPPPIPMDKSGC